MKKIKFVLPAASLLAIAGLVSCGNNRDVKPQQNITFANCYVKDRTGADITTEEDARVFPDWVYTNPDDYKGDAGTDLNQYAIGRKQYSDGRYKAIFGYVFSGDKTNDGAFTITGNKAFQIGEEINVTLTLGDFVSLNPIDGELVETPVVDPVSGQPTGEYEYSIKDPIYFKIYVAEGVTRDYNELKLGEQYTVTPDEANPTSVFNIHIPAKYARFSYKVYLSASYLDATDFEFNGFGTIPYNIIDPDSKIEESEFEKSVPANKAMEIEELSSTGVSTYVPAKKMLKSNKFYEITNSRVGNDLACVIYPNGMSGGASFTDDYLSRLAFWGVKYNEEDPEKPILKDITQYVHTNLVHYYVNVPTIQNDILSGGYNTARPISTNTYACRATLPWVNTEHPEGGMFTFNEKTRQYSLNYNYIGVNVQKAYVKDPVPFYADHTEIMTKFKVSYEEKSIASKPEVSFEYVDVRADKNNEGKSAAPYEPFLKVEATAKTGFAIKQLVGSLKITSKTTIYGDKYFKDLTISKPEDVLKALKGTGSGFADETTDWCEYAFRGAFDIDTRTPGKATLYIDLPEFLRCIAFGPDSYGNRLRHALPINNSALDSTVTLDMIESIEIGVFAIENK